ncbi:azurin [Yeosuana aromativorans]|uniref:Azurin n=2 Tax=Yeosuana aromativorans TaxID=288019 RepID=A0A8J3FDL7_9FLAO|nr:azurin [Yeosuana aromativorans]
MGCGNKEDKKKDGFTYEKSNTQKASETKTEDNVANIVLTANDMMQYNTKEIKVKSGQKVKLTLRHVGKLGVNVMGHNFVLLKKGTDLVAFATEASTQRDNKYIPKDSSDIIAHTDLIGGGQATSIEFDAPEAGTYEFLCSFPGHYTMMRGKFIVE